MSATEHPSGRDSPGRPSSAGDRARNRADDRADGQAHDRTNGDLPVRLRSLLAEERARAEVRIEALTRDLADILERSSEAVRDDEHDPEGATIAFERAQVTALLDAARAKLAEVAAAQDRIASGEPLVCRRCGATLPPERLLARPTTDTCVRCAT